MLGSAQTIDGGEAMPILQLSEEEIRMLVTALGELTVTYPEGSDERHRAQALLEKLLKTRAS